MDERDGTRDDTFGALLAQLAAAPARAVVPEALLHFEILAKLGEGGMGAVYKAHDRKLGRIVAIKCVTARASADPHARARLLHEARAASALSHPAIVTIHAIEEAAGVDFIVMEYVEGETLAARIARGPLPVDEAVAIVAEVADAIAVAHAAGLVHRDLKPANLVITPRGRAKVLDFGIAKAATGALAATAAAPVTATGALVGTVPYMAPEQLRGQPIDGRVDVFALGCVLYEALSGRRAFPALHVGALVEQITASEPPPPSTLVATVPAALDAVVARALAKDPAARFADVDALARALRAPRDAMASAPVASAPVLGPLLVGRDVELEALDHALTAARAGQGRLAVIAGEPGLGKSALVETFVARAHGTTGGIVLGRGRCLEQFGAREAYLPLFDLLGDLLAGAHGAAVRETLIACAPTWAVQLQAASATGLDALSRESFGATKERMVRELGDALVALAARAPVVVVLEDLHWCEPSTVDVIQHLAHRVGRHRVLLVGTLRPEEVDVPGHPLRTAYAAWRLGREVTHVALRPLAARDLETWLDARFAPNDFAHALAAIVETRTEGNPLFASAMIEWLLARGEIARVDGGWRGPRDPGALGVPESLRDLLRAKLDALAPDARRCLEVAAVQGDELLSAVVAAVLGIDELAIDDALAALARVRLVVALGDHDTRDGAGTARWRFAHVLYRDVLYADLAPRRRTLYHRDTARALAERVGSGPALAATLAAHAELGRDLEQASRYRVEAGTHAMALLAVDEAVHHFGAALAALAQSGAADRDARAGEIERARALALVAGGRVDEAVSHLRAALARAREGQDALLVGTLHAGLADALIAGHQLAEAEPHLDAALALAGRGQLAELHQEVLGLRALHRLLVGDLDACDATLAEIAEPGPLALHVRGLLRYFWSAYADAARDFAAAADANERALADGLLLMESRMFRALAIANLGRLGEALTGLRAVLEHATRNANTAMVARLENSIGWVLRELGQVELAIAHDERAAAAGRDAGETEAEANALVNLAEDRLARDGASATTGEAFARVTAIADADAWVRWRYTMRLAAARARRAVLTDADAAPAIAALATAARTYRAAKYGVVAAELAARHALAHADHAAARAAIAEGDALLAGAPCPLVAWRLGVVAVEYGRAIADRVRIAAGQEQVRAAVSVIVDGLAGTDRAVFLAQPELARALASKEG